MPNETKEILGEVFTPSPEVVASANVTSYDEMTRLADRDLRTCWGARAEEFEMRKDTRRATR
ncbi:MAG: hypothetical protein AB1817_05870 [Chloroflexota bacterium]